jgi:hypothetical protein
MVFVENGGIVEFSSDDIWFTVPELVSSVFICLTLSTEKLTTRAMARAAGKVLNTMIPQSSQLCGS